MYKVTDMLGKKLIDLDTARDLGNILGVSWNKLGGCAVLTEQGSFCVEKILVKDAVSALLPTQVEGYAQLSTEKAAYDTSGKYLGKLADVEIGNTCKIAKIHLDDGSVFSRGRLYAVGDVLLIRTRTPVKAANKPKNSQKTPTNGGKKLTTAQWLQNRRYGDFSFLIGKTVDKTITNFQGELMIKQGERVTNTILRQAKVSGKLIELCLHAK